MLPNASYFAFTATPKNKTLEIFGEPWPEGDVVKHRSFHSYTMKQAIQEGFILDVLKHYTPVESYYWLAKTVEDDPEFDTKKAQEEATPVCGVTRVRHSQKAEIMVDHFHDQVLAKHKIGGQARAMVVTSGSRGPFITSMPFAITSDAQKSLSSPSWPFQENTNMAGKRSRRPHSTVFQQPDRGEDPSGSLSFLDLRRQISDGYDEPLLHTMYVDKPLSGIKAVQTLSRLNRAHPKKHDTFVLDFMNDAETIQKSFEPYYRSTILSAETDPNKLHDLKADLDGYQVYNDTAIDQLVERYLSGADRDQLDPILDICVATYVDTLDEDGQVDFKGKAKTFVRTYGFLASVLPYSHVAWEKLSIFLNFLIPKLPAPKEEDLSKGIIEAIDMDSYRAEVRSAIEIALADQDAEIEPVPATGGGRMPEPELDHLSNIVRSFNDQFGNIDWQDADKIRQVLVEEIPIKVAADKAYQNAMRHSDKQNARIEHDKALQRVLVGLLSDHTELYKQFSDNPSFKKWLSDSIFTLTYEEAD